MVLSTFTSKAIIYSELINNHLTQPWQMSPLKIRLLLSTPNASHKGVICFKTEKEGCEREREKKQRQWARGRGNAKKKNGETLVHIRSAYWHNATKAISQLNLYGSISAVSHINDDCWSGPLERSNFITSIPNQFSLPDADNTAFLKEQQPFSTASRVPEHGHQALHDICAS